jgi:large subunit ribosomal protein L35
VRDSLPGSGHPGSDKKLLQANKHCVSHAVACRRQFQGEGAAMPKMKTKKSAAKRFRVRPGGTVKRGAAYKRHILTKKSTTRKRHLRGVKEVHETNMGSIAKMMPFAGL